MEISPDTCNRCWNGQYVDEICTSCKSKKRPPAERCSNALPLRAVLKQRYIIGDVQEYDDFTISYSAWDKTQNIRIFLKELYPRDNVHRDGNDLTVKVEDGMEDSFLEQVVRFVDEACLLRSMGTQCVGPRIYDLFHANGTVYCSMECLDGCNLRSYLQKNGPMKWEFLQPLLLEVLQALEVLHAQKRIHANINLDNLFLTKNNELWIIGFGSTRNYQEATMVSIPAYSIPIEQYKTNGKLGPYADLYALSATVYYLLTGVRVASAPDRVVMASKVIPLKVLCPQLPDRVAEAIEKGMSLKAEDRFQTAGEYIHALTGTSAPPPEGNRTYWIQGKKGFFAGKRKKLEKGKEIRIGRMLPNEICFPREAMGIARRHCSLFISTSGDIFIKDNHSSYGTFLNNQRVGENWTKVISGSYLRIGGEMLQLYYTGE